MFLRKFILFQFRTSNGGVAQAKTYIIAILAQPEDRVKTGQQHPVRHSPAIPVRIAMYAKKLRILCRLETLRQACWY